MSVTAVEAPAVARDLRFWTFLRLGLTVVAFVVLLVTGLLHRTDASVEDLRADVERGSTRAVTVVGAPSTEGEGHSQQTITWRTGLRAWQVEVVSTIGQVEASRLPDGEVVRGDVTPGLLTLQPDLRLTLVPWPDASLTVAGIRGPPWLMVPLLVSYALGMCLLVAGPQPWLATRWAWFWLLTAPGGAVAFLLLSGPTPGVPIPRRGSTRQRRRLTGGWALVLAVVLGPAVTAGLSEIADLVWPPHP